jgi:hypothetical protein
MGVLVIPHELGLVAAAQREQRALQCPHLLQLLRVRCLQGLCWSCQPQQAGVLLPPAKWLWLAW